MGWTRRCAAPVSEEALEIRSRFSVTDRRCLHEGTIKIERKWFCSKHAPIWRKHYEIVRRIRSLR